MLRVIVLFNPSISEAHKSETLFHQHYSLVLNPLFKTAALIKVFDACSKQNY
ncbi:hypothetical protein GPSY_4908 [Paraglaciecola psychrophila 170]|jgi:hypothetical protein|nr:hypothetical protein GPSY_4908 [Paraglaciecola psychrophila 170]